MPKNLIGASCHNEVTEVSLLKSCILNSTSSGKIIIIISNRSILFFFKIYNCNIFV